MTNIYFLERLRKEEEKTLLRLRQEAEDNFVLQRIRREASLNSLKQEKKDDRESC